ncbi:hypothetical protein ICV89_09600 [Polynucleobacter sp. Adler-ghost]|nr:hypothetical protein ICV89_09600 [Polynucleobacter sp. Adler-ghost]
MEFEREMDKLKRENDRIDRETDRINREILKSNGVGGNQNSRNPDLYFLGNKETRSFYIIKSMIKKSKYDYIYFQLFVNSSVPQYKNNITYYSRLLGGHMYCQLPTFLVLSDTYFSEENLFGREVILDDQPKKFTSDGFKTDPILVNIKKYLCR